MCWISQAIPNDQLIYHKQWSRLCTLLLHHLRHISCKTVKKACLPMHSCKFSRKKVWRVSPSRSFTYLHSRKTKNQKTWDPRISQASVFIPCCTSHHVYFLLHDLPWPAPHPAIPTHHDARWPPFPNSNPFNCKWQILQAAAGCLQEGSPHPLLDIKTKGWSEVCTMRHVYEYLSSVHICPELSWHPRGKRKTTKRYNKSVIKTNDQLVNSKMLTNSAFVHLDVF